MTNIHRSLILGCSMLALAGCGGDQIVSPGTGGDIIVENPAPAPAPTPSPTPTPTPMVTPAAGCPTINSSGGLTDAGTITGDTGEYRVCTLPASFDESDNLPYIEGLLYSINGRVDVGTDGGAVPSDADSDVTLSIEPGAILYGATGRSYLVVNRGNQIDAVGEPDMPIVFTSRDNVLGLSTDGSDAQWGGVVLLGRAPVSDCRDGVPNKANQASCEQILEGAAVETLFGGNTPGDSSGTMQYFQIRYSGFTLEGGSELQSLTTGGIGSGTTIDHWMSFNSSDDGTEFFGGRVNMKNVVVVGASDDSLDVDTGAQANLQYVIVAQRANTGDNLVELDSPDEDYTTGALPRTNLQIANATFLSRSTGSSQALRLRGGAQFSLVNSVIDIEGDRTCVRLDETVTLAQDPLFASVVADCGTTQPFRGSSGVTDAQVAAAFNDGDDTDAAFAITLTGSFINGTGETGVAAYNPTALSSYFDETDYIGAVADQTDTWYEGWTCDSATLTFGNNTGPCTELPVYS
ncbi:hypothetical protein [Croceicoccus marinus]|uniref:Serine/threonine protein kinase n=1 Tax=Croceicoccus marinus TaxID=450378 RepID=A0A7G6VRW2_9SPHN|nr:hypothetical protein [Croceicoccus marinus]QNE04477.1 hypothetical protein H4O24_10890 [Croceicoccus marinus]